MSERPEAIDELSEGAQSVARVLRYFFGALGVFMVLSVGFYCLSGFFIVETNEHVLVMRFGRIVRVENKEGWNLTWPKPISTKFRRVVTRPVTVESNYFWQEETADRLGQDPRAKKKPKEGPMRVGKDGYVITADNNIAHAKWSVIYRIGDLKDFYTRYTEPEDALRLLLRNVVIKEAARLKIDTILSGNKDLFRLAVRKALRAEVDRMQLGVSIEDVQLVAKAYPETTKAAFEAVTNANSDVSTVISKARGYAATTANAASGQAREILQEAEAYKRHLEATAVADADFVKNVAKQYRENGASVLLPQYVDALTEVVKVAKHVVVVYPNQEVRVTVEPETDGNKKEPKDKPKQ